VRLSDLCVDAPPVGVADWNDVGVVVLPNFLSESLMLAYEGCWVEENRVLRDRPGGWPDCTPFRRFGEVADLLCDAGLAGVLEGLLGEPAGLHLNLTGWVSTGRDWHQDSYLNPSHVGDFYAAVWIALGSIDADSGPFQFVPGSHRWPQVTREKILGALPVGERDHRWPKFSERILTPLFEEQIVSSGAEVVTYLPSRGDVLVWHGRLLHRGSQPNIPGLERKAVIAHYSGINHRKDMPAAVQHHSGGWYFPIDDLTQVG